MKDLTAPRTVFASPSNLTIQGLETPYPVSRGTAHLTSCFLASCPSLTGQALSRCAPVLWALVPTDGLGPPAVSMAHNSFSPPVQLTQHLSQTSSVSFSATLTETHTLKDNRLELRRPPARTLLTMFGRSKCSENNQPPK